MRFLLTIVFQVREINLISQIYETYIFSDKFISG